MKTVKSALEGVKHHRYNSWKESAYNKAKVLKLDDDRYIEHRKDADFCTLKSKENTYGYKGLKIDNIEVTERYAYDCCMYMKITCGDIAVFIIIEGN